MTEQLRNSGEHFLNIDDLSRLLNQVSKDDSSARVEPQRDIPTRKKPASVEISTVLRKVTSQPGAPGTGIYLNVSTHGPRS
jgi:hypothetical protein